MRAGEMAMGSAYSPVQSEGAIVLRFDARDVAQRFRPAAILAALDMLRPGETMRLVSDSDPAPLVEEAKRRYGPAMTSRWVERGGEKVVVDLIRE
jgi:uncharacterized protein (DUF2249 family)